MKFNRIELAHDEKNVATMVEFNETTGEHNFSVIASKEGCFIRGQSPQFAGNSELKEFAKALGDAVNEHARLAGKATYRKGEEPPKVEPKPVGEFADLAGVLPLATKKH